MIGFFFFFFRIVAQGEDPTSPLLPLRTAHRNSVVG
jgi:hypothetical protein